MSEDGSEGNDEGNASTDTPSFDGKLITNVDGSESSENSGSKSSDSDSG